MGFGDILIIRSGFAAFGGPSEDEAGRYASVITPILPGVAESKEVLEWIWAKFSDW